MTVLTKVIARLLSASELDIQVLNSALRAVNSLCKLPLSIGLMVKFAKESSNKCCHGSTGSSVGRVGDKEGDLVWRKV